MHCRDIEDLFIFFLDVLGGGACDFWSWVSQCCRAWCIAANHAFGRPRIVELLCFCVTVSALPLSKWSCDEHVSKFFGGYLLSDAALVKYVMPDSLQPSFHAHDLAFMRFPASKWPLMHHGHMYTCGCHCWTKVILKSDLRPTWTGSDTSKNKGKGGEMSHQGNFTAF
jgi:hypothetical protein